jgi:hypothetical protein
MDIEGTTFGTITIDGKTYEHDVIIRLSGEVVKRKKKLSKKYYGTSHVLSGMAETNRYRPLAIQTAELKPSNTLFPHRSSQEAPIWANGSAKEEIPPQCASAFTSTTGGG